MKIKNLEEKRWGVGFLFIGIIVGVMGNLFANMLDRHFMKFGWFYEIFITASFLLMIWYLSRYFTKILLSDK